MHIDAFFEYLMGKQHGYYMQVPPPTDPFPDVGRDGVPLEEDLAIRALDPRFRPKRGRRKAEDGDDDVEELPTPPPKRPHVDTTLAFAASNHYEQPQSAYPQSAYPQSAHPDHMERFDPWAAATANLNSAITPGSVNPNSRLLTPQSTTSAASAPQLRWRLNTQDNPSTPHPLSATPVTAHPDSAFDEPQSAVTPSSSKARSRRRHGPAVSSAWPSNNNSSSGKLRGRPPSNRSVRDGPFVTFPANPKTKEGPVIDLNRNTPGPTPVAETPITAMSDPGHQTFRFPPTPASAISMSSQQSTLTGRPERLSLQVPPHIGGPVHLVTPTVLVNGESEPSSGTPLAASAMSASSQKAPPTFFNGSESGEHSGGFVRPANPRAGSHSPAQSISRGAVTVAESSSSTTPTMSHESIKRALAADLLRADVSGRKRLRGSEAKKLAETILGRLPMQPKASNVAGHDQDLQTQLIGVATLLGLTNALGVLSSSSASTKKISVRRFRVGGDGYDSPIDDDDGNGEEDREDDPRSDRAIKESTDVTWSVMVGGLTAECSVKAIVVESGDDGDQEDSIMDVADNPGGWKKRWEEVTEKLKKKEAEVRRLREQVLEAVL